MTMDSRGRCDASTDATCKEQHSQQANGAAESLAQRLPNELLGAILDESSVAWTNALVCSRWHALVDALSLQYGPEAECKRVRPLHASSALDALRHLSPTKIQGVLESVLPVATPAHLLPLLAASDEPNHLKHIIDLWSDEERPMDSAESAQWIKAHRQIESRFDPLWPGRVRKRIRARCDHYPTDVRSIASCVLLSVAARSTCSPAVLNGLARFCRDDEKALRKATLVAAAHNRRDVMGSLLYLYAQHHWGTRARYTVERGNLQYFGIIATGMLKNLYVTAATYGSLECARTVDLLATCKGVTPTMIMTDPWNKYAHCESCKAAIRWSSASSTSNSSREPCALGALNVVAAEPMALYKRYCLRAAVIADRPEMLGLCAIDLESAWVLEAFVDVVRLGRERFSEAMAARFSHDVGGLVCAAINDRANEMPFTLGGVRWLASQDWYTPLPDTVCRIINGMSFGMLGTVRCIQKDSSRIERLCNTVDALGIMAERWPTIVKAALGDQRNRVASLLVSCIVRASTCDDRDILEVFVGHLVRCALLDAREGRSATERVWSYLHETATANATAAPRNWSGHDGCVETQAAVVFAMLLHRHRRALPKGVEAHGQTRLQPLSRRRAAETLFKEVSCKMTGPYYDAALQYLDRHGLLSNS